MKVILTADLRGRGVKGDILEVSRGYAFNYLIPEHKAIPATTENLAAQTAEQDNTTPPSPAVKDAGAHPTKPCPFCSQDASPDYKDPATLRRYLTDRGRLKPRRVTAVCTAHQNDLATAIARARHMALLPEACPRGW